MEKIIESIQVTGTISKTEKKKIIWDKLKSWR